MTRDGARRSWFVNLNHEKVVSISLANQWTAAGTEYRLARSAPGDIAVAYSEPNCNPDSVQLSFQSKWMGFKTGDQEGSLRSFRDHAPKSFRIVKSAQGDQLRFSYSASLMSQYIHEGGYCYNNGLAKFPFAGLV